MRRAPLSPRPAPLRERAWYPLFAHASFIPRNVWDLDILVIFPYHVTSQMFTVEMANCFDSAAWRNLAVRIEGRTALSHEGSLRR